MRPVWDWGEQFSDKDIVLFSNPLYNKKQAYEFCPDPKPTRASVIPGGIQLINADELKQFFRSHQSGASNHQSIKLSRNIQQMKIEVEKEQPKARREVSETKKIFPQLNRGQSI